MFNRKEEEKRKQLVEDIERLKKENATILDDIDKIKQKDERMRAKYRVGNSAKKLYWRMPVKFIDSVFYTRKEELAKENDVCMMHSEFTSIISFVSPYPYRNQEKETFHMAVFCEDIIETEKGFRLALLDPYARMLSNELLIDSDAAYAMKGHIIYVDFMDSPDKDSDIFIKRWKKTDLTLHGYKGRQDPVINPIAKVLLEIKDVSSENEAIQAVTALQNYYRMTESNCKVARISPTQIRILKDMGANNAILYGVAFVDGEFWFYTEPEHKYLAQETSSIEKEMWKRAGSTPPTYEKLSTGRWVFKFANERTVEIDEELLNDNK